MSQHQLQTYKDEEGQHRWRVVVLAPVPHGPNDEVAPSIVADSSQGYSNKSDMMKSFFGIFFGDWDDSFLGEYNEWSPADNQVGA